MRTVKSSGALMRAWGMIHSVHSLWVLGHKCCDIHEAIAELSGSKHTTSETHIELGTTQKTQDFIDLVKIIQWLLTFNPFM